LELEAKKNFVLKLKLLAPNELDFFQIILSLVKIHVYHKREKMLEISCLKKRNYEYGKKLISFFKNY
jgi:hypothetical protein